MMDTGFQNVTKFNLKFLDKGTVENDFVFSRTY